MMNFFEFSAAGEERHGSAEPIQPSATQSSADDGHEAGDEKSEKTSPSAAEDEEEDDDGEGKGSMKWTKPQWETSLPGTPQHRRALRWSRGPDRKCASESEAYGSGSRRRRGWARETKLDRAWEIRKCRAGVSGTFVPGSGGSGGGEKCECLVVVQPGGGCPRRICMDMEEVRACRDLGLGIPRDFTVEIPGGLSGNSGGCDSPISVSGEDAKEMKAKLKLWAHAVAFVSSATRSGH